ncbi:MAG: hypothetical protein PHR47_01710 [Candidatus Pacebacteria bacterium]|nr:hypothetical protein [Candidatus Paceibacterota bacterium]
MNKDKFYNNGFIIVEVLLAISILAMFFVAFIGAIIYNRQIYKNASNRQSAILLAEEGIEAVRNIRDGDFDSLFNGSYELSDEGGKWSLDTNLDKPGNFFTRRIVISSIGFNKKQILSSVSWNEYGHLKSVSLTSYLTNWKE